MAQSNAAAVLRDVEDFRAAVEIAERRIDQDEPYFGPDSLQAFANVFRLAGRLSRSAEKLAEFVLEYP